ncbi:MAG: hypothetical protein J6A75_05885 [Lachnospiraceae bacterium]|nr:hypothetical protein [Lachnospiraceae bacterium]
MLLNNVSGKSFLEKIQTNDQQDKKSQESASEKFLENLKGKIDKKTTEESLQESKAVTFSEAVDRYEEFVEQRIKDGPPKIQIGGAAYTNEEWERLLRKMDKDIDAYKEELRERVRRQQEKEILEEGKSGAVEDEEDILDLPVTESIL